MSAARHLERRPGILRRAGSSGVVVLFLWLAALPAMGQETEEPAAAWSNQAELALVQTGGNSKSLTFSLNDRLTRHWERAELTVDANALRAESTDRVVTNVGGAAEVREESRVTAEKYGLSAKYDREIAERLGWFTLGGWQRNEIAGIQDRYNLGGGISYTLVESERQSLVGEGGVGLTDEHPVVGEAKSFLTARLLSRYERQLSPTSSFQTQLEAIQNLDDSDDLRIEYLLAVTAKINSKLALKASYTLSYDHDPASQIVPGDDPGEPPAIFALDTTDTVLSMSVVIDF